ncbi:hypothetical protein CH341_23475 [Rhodoplanes roseus]|uniref:Uncharacterized protein n=2 Tax=Rhodoplanes roseus TaxID=29409 RepID=A0A327KYT2_9BRAD|nr:hypothetical protein CH341_23475 [Rhodoplanes roseus]
MLCGLTRILSRLTRILSGLAGMLPGLAGLSGLRPGRRSGRRGAGGTLALAAKSALGLASLGLAPLRLTPLGLAPLAAPARRIEGEGRDGQRSRRDHGRDDDPHTDHEHVSVFGAVLRPVGAEEQDASRTRLAGAVSANQRFFQIASMLSGPPPAQAK